MVAKSYQKMKQLGEPFKDKGKMYVKVITEKGNEKTVRWYSDIEYAKMYPDEKYKYDYIWALIMHAFSWAFITMLPMTFVTAVGPLFYVVFAANVAIHAYVDHMKANQFKINLWQDQLAHMVQIVLTFIIL